ncbi:MAG: hypothetical protein MUF24_07070 [Chitinophagaceae bacterium]|nr:hypothetical protein [Chitinophagaceae bacterium]
MKNTGRIFWAVIGFLPLFAAAQNLTGIWRGTFYNPMDLQLGGSKYRYEVQLNNKGREVKGVTYSYQTTRFYGKASLVGMWSQASKTFTLKEDRMLDLKIEGGGDGCLMTCYLTYRKEGDKEYLEGTYTSINMNEPNAGCGGGKVVLEKVPDTDFELEDFLLKKGNNTGNNTKVKPGQEAFVVKKPTPNPPPAVKKPNPAPNVPATNKPPVKAPEKKEVAKPAPRPGTTPPAKTNPVAGAKKPVATTPPATKPKEQPGPKPAAPIAEPEKVIAKPVQPEAEKPKPLPPTPAEIKNRKNELFKTITTSQKRIQVTFYDNGEIDGDTISIFNNAKLVAAKQGLSAKPITVVIELDEVNDQQDVIMVAENLGRIPPNTALMIIEAGGQRYTVSLTSTEQKNAMVRFKYQPEKQDSP